MEREALKLALEALEESQTDNDTMEFWDRKSKAITAIKEALAQPAQEPVGSLSVRYYRGSKGMTNTDFDYTGDLPEGDYELYTTPPLPLQPAQEPVAWGWRYDSCGHAVVNRLVATETSKPTLFLKNVFARGPFPLYAAPPQREWVGLTDDELADLWYKESLDWMEFARAHEAALKEKNNG